MSLHLVTPGFRPEFIKRQIKYLNEYKDEDFIWHIIMDDKIEINLESYEFYDILKTKINLHKIKVNYTFGYEQRTYFTEHLSQNYNDNDWLYFLDDDNLPSPDVFECYKKYLNNNDIDFVIMSQIRFFNPAKRLYGKPEWAKLGAVDIGSFICKLKNIKGFRMEILLYNYDGHFIETFKGKLANKFAYEESFSTLYNVLHV